LTRIRGGRARAAAVRPILARALAAQGKRENAMQVLESRLRGHLVAPLPEIRLVADHTIVEYGAVHFSKGNIDLWLPKTAEVFNELKGRRIHRRA
jgi:hypothetical protein